MNWKTKVAGALLPLTMLSGCALPAINATVGEPTTAQAAPATPEPQAQPKVYTYTVMAYSKDGMVGYGDTPETATWEPVGDDMEWVKTFTEGTQPAVLVGGSSIRTLCLIEADGVPLVGDAVNGNDTVAYCPLP